MRIFSLLLIISILCAPEIPLQAATLARCAVAVPAPVAAPVREETSPEEWWWVKATVTGYSPYDKRDAGRPDTQDTKTSTMRDWREHPYGIAADPRIIPYGSFIHVPGYLPKKAPYTAWEVDDTGGDLRQDWEDKRVIHIDLRYQTEWSANQFGRRRMNILIEVTDMTDAQKRRLRPYKVSEL